jgi:ABC-type amino acid transport substrate-binding protein
LKKLFVLAVSVFIFSVQPLLSAELTILTENLPNLNYIKDGELVGLSVDIVKEIQKDLMSKLRSFHGLEPIIWLYERKMLYCLV